MDGLDALGSSVQYGSNEPRPAPFLIKPTAHLPVPRSKDARFEGPMSHSNVQYYRMILSVSLVPFKIP
jgi:hypothetical protein